MVKARKKTPRFKKMLFEVPVERSALSLIGCGPKGYSFVGFERCGIHVTITYKKD